jgi:hypothetical protein
MYHVFCFIETQLAFVGCLWTRKMLRTPNSRLTLSFLRYPSSRTKKLQSSSSRSRSWQTCIRHCKTWLTQLFSRIPCYLFTLASRFCVPGQRIFPLHAPCIVFHAEQVGNFIYRRFLSLGLFFLRGRSKSMSSPFIHTSIPFQISTPSPPCFGRLLFLTFYLLTCQKAPTSHSWQVN